MAEISEEDCLVIRQSPLEPTIGHLRQLLQQAIKKNSTDSDKTEPLSPEDQTESNSLNGNTAAAEEELGNIHADLTTRLH